MSLSVPSRNYKESQVSASHDQIVILVERIQVLEVTLQMIGYNLRCLNIRQGSQPIELPAFQADPYQFPKMKGRDDLKLEFISEGLFDQITLEEMVPVYKQGFTCDEIPLGPTYTVNELPLELNLIREDKPFGACETAWAK